LAIFYNIFNSVVVNLYSDDNVWFIIFSSDSKSWILTSRVSVHNLDSLSLILVSALPSLLTALTLLLNDLYFSMVLSILNLPGDEF